VLFRSYYSNKIFIIGDVARTGEYQIYEPLDVMKAIAMCGGLKNPKVKKIKIIRTDGTIVNVDMKSFWGEGAKRNNTKYVLYPGDTMYVPESFNIPWGLISTVLGVVNLSLQIFLAVNNLSS